MSNPLDPSFDRDPSTEPIETPRPRRRPDTSLERQREAPDLARSGRGWPAEPAGTWTI